MKASKASDLPPAGEFQQQKAFVRKVEFSPLCACRPATSPGSGCQYPPDPSRSDGLSQVCGAIKLYRETGRRDHMPRRGVCPPKEAGKMPKDFGLLCIGGPGHHVECPLYKPPGPKKSVATRHADESTVARNHRLIQREDARDA